MEEKNIRLQQQSVHISQSCIEYTEITIDNYVMTLKINNCLLHLSCYLQCIILYGVKKIAKIIPLDGRTNVTNRY